MRWAPLLCRLAPVAGEHRSALPGAGVLIFSADNTRQGPLITIFAKPFHNDKGELQGDEFFAVNDEQFFAHFRVFAQGIEFPPAAAII